MQKSFIFTSANTGFIPAKKTELAGDVQLTAGRIISPAPAVRLMALHIRYIAVAPLLVKTQNCLPNFLAFLGNLIRLMTLNYLRLTHWMVRMHPLAI